MSNNAESQPGQKFGDAVKGIFKSAHGAGEAIRGAINDNVDKAGEGLVAGTSSDKDYAERKAKLATQSGESENSEHVANKGVEEFKQGLNKVEDSTK